MTDVEGEDVEALAALIARAGVRPAVSEPLVALVDPGLVSTDPDQLAYGLFKASGMSILVFWDGRLDALCRLVIERVPAFAASEVRGGAAFARGVEGCLWLGFEGNRGSVLAFFGSGSGDVLLTDVLRPMSAVPAPAQWGLGVVGARVPRSAARILDDARVVPLWDLPYFAGQRPAGDGGPAGQDTIGAAAAPAGLAVGTPVLADEPRRSVTPLIAPPTQSPPPIESYTAKGTAAMGGADPVDPTRRADYRSSGAAGSRSKLLLIAGAAGLLLAGIAGLFNIGMTKHAAPVVQPSAGSLPQDLHVSPREVGDTGAEGVQLPPSQSVGDTDLGLSVPMSYPRCDGSGIVVLGNVVPPRRNWQDAAAGVQRLLEQHPGASYLRTDTACPSLRQADESGNPIYAVFRAAGRSKREVCDAVRAAGADAYGKWLDTATPATYIIQC